MLNKAECDMFAGNTQIASTSKHAKIRSKTSNNDLANISELMATNKLSIITNNIEFMLINAKASTQMTLK